jgi:hypothetical protein
VTSQTFLTLTINSKKNKKDQSCKIDITRFIIKQIIIICNSFYLKHLTFINIIDQNNITKIISEFKNTYILGQREYYVLNPYNFSFYVRLTRARPVDRLAVGILRFFLFSCSDFRLWTKSSRRLRAWSQLPPFDDWLDCAMWLVIRP